MHLSGLTQNKKCNKRIYLSSQNPFVNMKYMQLTKRDNHYIDVAYDASQYSRMLMKHGACVVENNRVIGVASNSSRTQFKDKFIGVSCSCHAEMNALRNAIKSRQQHQCFSVPRKKKSHWVLCSKGNY